MSPERERMTVRKEEATTSGKARARLGRVVQRTGAFCAKIDLLLLALQDNAKGTEMKPRATLVIRKAMARLGRVVQRTRAFCVKIDYCCLLCRTLPKEWARQTKPKEATRARVVIGKAMARLDRVV